MNYLAKRASLFLTLVSCSRARYSAHLDCVPMAVTACASRVYCKWHATHALAPIMAKRRDEARGVLVDFLLTRRATSRPLNAAVSG
jgi:hypothetical protein